MSSQMLFYNEEEYHIQRAIQQLSWNYHTQIDTVQIVADLLFGRGFHIRHARNGSEELYNQIKALTADNRKLIFKITSRGSTDSEISSTAESLLLTLEAAAYEQAQTAHLPLETPRQMQ